MSATEDDQRDLPGGLLHVETDYPIDLLEELHDWYNNEHLPERLSVPGIVGARRYAALEGGARWLALYDLTSPKVMESEAYRHFFAAGETAWTRRILLRHRRNFRRTVYERLWSGAGKDSDSGTIGPPGLFSLRLGASTSGAGPAVSGDDVELRTLLDSPGVGRAALYRDVANPDESLLLADLSGVWAVQDHAFRRAWSRLAVRLTDEDVRFERGLQLLLFSAGTSSD